MTKKYSEAVDEFFTFLASHGFDFFGEVFPIEVLGVVLAEESALGLCPGVEVAIVVVHGQ
jgi:hypothetical protein